MPATDGLSWEIWQLDFIFIRRISLSKEKLYAPILSIENRAADLRPLSKFWLNSWIYFSGAKLIDEHHHCMLGKRIRYNDNNGLLLVRLFPPWLPRHPEKVAILDAFYAKQEAHIHRNIRYANVRNALVICSVDTLSSQNPFFRHLLGVKPRALQCSEHNGHSIVTNSSQEILIRPLPFICTIPLSLHFQNHGGTKCSR